MSDETMQAGPTGRLSAMMFLQFFIWGAWYTMVGQYLEVIGMSDAIGWVYTVGPLAAMISPLFLGMVADRFFSSERVLAVLMAAGGVAMLLAPAVARSCSEAWAETLRELTGGDSAKQAEAIKEAYGDGYLGIFPPIIPDHLPFVGILFLHMLCYMPTLGLTNAIAFRNIRSQERQFPVIRVFGTIGWIVAGAILGYGLHLDETPWTLYTTGGACLLLAVYSFALPHTPPAGKGKKSTLFDVLGLRAVALMKQPAYAVFILSSMLICIPLAGYYAIAPLFINDAGFHSAGGVLIWGQVSEIVFMLLIPFFFRKLGVKWMLAVGMLAWVIRYVLFSAAAPDGLAWMILIGILLHGICYDFFFVTGFIYTDKKAGPEIRAQAQGFLVLMTQGLGLGLGAPVMYRILRDKRAPDNVELTDKAAALREEYAEQAEAGAQGAEELWERASELFLRATDWKAVWMYPAVMAAAVMVLFVLLFHDRVSKAGDGSGGRPSDERP